MGTQDDLVRDLRDYLNGRAPSLVTRPAHSYCDLAVGDVGILVYTDFGKQASEDLKRTSNKLSETYDYLVFYGHNLPANDFDRWRMGEFKHAALGLDMEDIEFIRYLEDSGTPEENVWPSRIWRFAQAIMAFLAIVIGLELAVIYNLQFAEGYTQLGAVPTFVAVLGLSASLVWVYDLVSV